MRKYRTARESVHSKVHGPKYLSLARFRNLAAKAQKSGDWQSLLKLGQTSSAVYAESEHEELRTAALVAKVRGLSRNQSWLPTDVDFINRREIWRALNALKTRASNFCQSPEYELYRNMLVDKTLDLIEDFERLQVSCRISPNMASLLQLRRAVLELLNRPRHTDEHLTSDVKDMLETLPELDIVLREAVVALKANEELGCLDAALISVLQVDLDMRTAVDSDVAGVLGALELLGNPPEALVSALSQICGPFNERQQLTPQSWAFLWELSRATESSLPGLVVRYSPSLASDLSDGLNMLIKSTFAHGPDAENLFVQAVELLMCYQKDAGGWEGRSVCVQAALGPVTLSVQGYPLFIAPADRLVGRVAQCAPPTFVYREELEVFSRFFACEMHQPTIARPLTASRSMEWLCTHSARVRRAVDAHR